MTGGAYYGDDYQGFTNYPIIRITNNANGKIRYVNTHNHSFMGVACPKILVTTFFDVPIDINIKSSKLEVVCNGIPSLKFSLNITSN